MSAFTRPRGLLRPTGGRRPGPLRSPWHVGGPRGATRGSRAERRAARRAVRQALSAVRLAPGAPVRIVVCEDLSGSMDSIAVMREAVLEGLLGWAHRNLGPDDELAVVSFGGDACVRLPPSPPARGSTLADPALHSYATMLGPTWELISAFPGTNHLTVAVLISDGLVSDLTQAGGRAAAGSAGVDGVALLIPASGSFGDAAPLSWRSAYPDDPAHVVGGGDGGLATAVVEAIAVATGRDVHGIGLTGRATPDSPSGITSGDNTIDKQIDKEIA